jgi:formyltetrahydrofolate deformylase
VDIPAIVSNHPDYAALAASYGIPFHHLPLPTGSERRGQARAGAAGRGADRGRAHRPGGAGALHADPQPEFCRALAGRAINIHHSFLPSFKGAKPYFQAHAAA